MSFKETMTEFVAMANDQTDDLVSLMEKFKSETVTPTARDFELIISHMRLLQRSLAKSAMSEIETLEEIDKRLKKLE